MNIPSVHSCRICKKEKPATAFYKNATKLWGINTECKICCKQERQKYYIKNKDKLDRKARLWVLANPAKHKNNEMKRKYNISVEAYQEMLNKQQFKCAICSKTVEQNGQDLAVDHCHNTNAVRGLLCKSCNRGLGMFSDKEEILERALEYLRNAK